eukprot:1060443-Prymnesium_polylepis.2
MIGEKKAAAAEDLARIDELREALKAHELSSGQELVREREQSRTALAKLETAAGKALVDEREQSRMALAVVAEELHTEEGTAADAEANVS